MSGFNPFRNRFPYTNINDINLDWIIKKVKALSEAVAHIDISRIDEIAQQAEAAQQDAETALTTANSVQGIANNALTTAQSAETTAQSAETTANSVQGIANIALTTAQSAQTTATQAASDAQSAISIGDNAATIAGLARSEAQSAQTAVNALDDSKADKVRGATLGNFASLAASGNLLDSGHNSSDYALAAAAVPAGGATGQVLTKTGAADYAAAWQTPSGGSGDVSADMIGIVITGARPSVAVTAGQYVIVKNSTIAGVVDGLYTAVNPLSPSTDVSAADLAAVSDGGLNDITRLTSYTNNVFTYESGVTLNVDYSVITTYGRLAIISFNAAATYPQTQSSGALTIATIDSAIKPKFLTEIIGIIDKNGTIVNQVFTLYDTGRIAIYASGNTIYKNPKFTGVFICE